MQTKPRPSLKDASLALANWLEIDLQHIENQLALTFAKSTNSTRKDLLKLHLQALQDGPVYLSCSLSAQVHAGSYACSQCHKAFKLSRNAYLHDCHSCAGRNFYRLHNDRLDEQTYH